MNLRLLNAVKIVNLLIFVGIKNAKIRILSFVVMPSVNAILHIRNVQEVV